MMFNILTDELPKSFEGYLINYNFRTGILISECMVDTAFDDIPNGEYERLMTASMILFGKGVPGIGTAVRGISWFLNGGVEQKQNDNGAGETLFSFVEDRNMIFSAFMTKYGINLNNSNMHFFEFLALFNDLDKTAFRRVVDLRAMKSKDIKKYSAEDRNEILKLKEQFALNKNKRPKTKFDKLIEGFKNAE